MKRKLKAIIWPIIYLILIINVLVSFILVFRSYYYKSIFVSGVSMEPTLNGHKDGRADYGIIDDHASALSRRNLKRFQIITTYYPWGDDYVDGYDPEKGKDNVIDKNESSYKIKRIYGFPGETIKFTFDEEVYQQLKLEDPRSAEAQERATQAIHFFIKEPGQEEFVEQKFNFKRKFNFNRLYEYNYEVELGDNQMWVMGDNYGQSSDCHSNQQPIYKDNLVGVLIAIEGTCKIDHKMDTDVDGTKGSYTCTNRKRHLPKYY